jgi:phage/plasmid-associated DNA primase
MNISSNMNSDIQITHDFYKSDTLYSTVNINDIEQYLKTHINCYERTAMFNRVYIDIDGKADINMTEDEFNIKDSSIEFILLNLELGTPFSLMKASKYNSRKNGKIKHIFSYRITLLKKYGSKPAIKNYVEYTLNPIIKEALKEEINYIIDKKEKISERNEDASTYLDYDEGVYSMGNPKLNTCGRKMRMWNSTKDDDYRPNILCGSATVQDTLITYISEDCECLPEPVKIKTPVDNDIMSVASFCGDPFNDTNSVLTTSDEKQIIIDILGNLQDCRWSNYKDWITIGMICYNEDIPFDIWDTFSRKSLKYENGKCLKMWNGFRKAGLRQGTLWQMLKEDNPIKFKELSPKRKDFKRLILSENGHADVADYFFSLKPDNYLYDNTMGWFSVQANNTWSNTVKSYPSSMVNDIFRTLKAEQFSFEKNIIHIQKNLLGEEGKEEEIKKQEDIKKKIAEFSNKISNKNFIEGIIVFLRGLYEDHTKLILLDYEKNFISEIMDEQRHLFAFNDCVYDLNICATRPIKQTDYITFTCGYNYPKSNPLVRKEIRDILFTIWEIHEMIEYFLDTTCTCVCGIRNIEEWYVWTGRGGNGKGMLMELISNALGAYLYNLPNDILTKRIDKPGCPNPDIYKARGKRFLNTTEPEENEPILEGTTKQLTGGDVLTARGLFKEPISYKPQFLLVLQCNIVPQLTTLTNGSVRRIRLVPFPFQFVQDPKLQNERKGDANVKNVKCRSKEWRDEFILMLLEQYQRVKNLTNIPIPLLVKETTEQYIQENNYVGSWFKENYIKINDLDENGNSYYIRSKSLYEDFRNTTGIKISDKSFKKAMEFNEIYSVMKTTEPDKGNKVYIGYMFNNKK